MKIAFFTDAYLDITGGVRTAVEAQKKTLEALGHTVYLFSPGFKRSDAKLKQLAKENFFIVPTCRLFIRGVLPTARRPHLVEKWILKQHPEEDRETDFCILRRQKQKAVNALLLMHC